MSENIAAVVQAYGEMTKHLVDLNMALVKLQNGQNQSKSEFDKIAETLKKLEESQDRQTNTITKYVSSSFCDKKDHDTINTIEFKRFLTGLFAGSTSIMTLIIVSILSVINFMMESKIQDAVKIAIENIK